MQGVYKDSLILSCKKSPCVHPESCPNLEPNQIQAGRTDPQWQGVVFGWWSLGPNIERRHVARVRFHSFFESNDWDHASLSGVCLARRNCDSAESGWMVGQAEVMARIGSAGITSGLPVTRAPNGGGRRPWRPSVRISTAVARRCKDQSHHFS